jgi:hypothetical protein
LSLDRECLGFPVVVPGSRTGTGTGTGTTETET